MIRVPDHRSSAPRRRRNQSPVAFSCVFFFLPLLVPPILYIQINVLKTPVLCWSVCPRGHLPYWKICLFGASSLSVGDQSRHISHRGEAKGCFCVLLVRRDRLQKYSEKKRRTREETDTEKPLQVTVGLTNAHYVNALTGVGESPLIAMLGTVLRKGQVHLKINSQKLQCLAGQNCLDNKN